MSSRDWKESKMEQGREEIIDALCQNDPLIMAMMRLWQAAELVVMKTKKDRQQADADATSAMNRYLEAKRMKRGGCR